MLDGVWAIISIAIVVIYVMLTDPTFEHGRGWRSGTAEQHRPDSGPASPDGNDTEGEGNGEGET